MKAVKKILLTIPVITVLIIGTIIIFKKDKIEVQLNGENNIQIKAKEEYADAGFIVFKNDKELNKKDYTYEEINTVDTNTLGKYYITYKINYKNEEYEVVRTIEVIDDEKPILTVNLDKIERDYCTQKDKTKLEYTSVDNYDGDITDKINIEEKDNRVILTTTDTSGNTSLLELPITYINKPSTETTFKVNGYSKMYIPINTKYNEEGASIKDGCGKVLSDDIITTGSVDTNIIGEYTIKYTSKKDTSLLTTRTVIVYEPNTKTIQKTSSEKVIYLTFDDGPYVYTNRILEILKKYNVKATFFVTNQFPSYTHLIQDEYNQGHTVAVHTYTHKWNVYESIDSYVNDFNKMNNLIQKYTGNESQIFRFPGGSSNTISRNYAKGIVSAVASYMTEKGYVYFDWDVDSTDAAGGSQTAIYNNVVNGVKKCSRCVVLMHDIQYNTYMQLDNILKTLTSQGYVFGTLSTGSPTCHHGINN